MSNKFLKFGLMAVLALSVAACDDDSDNDKGGDTNACSANEKKCDGDFVVICSNGSWQKNVSPCPNGCDAGSCKTGGNPGPDIPAQVCTEGATECEGDNLKRCVSNSWKLDKCEHGCDVNAKKCKVPDDVEKVCTEGDKRCNGNNLESCVSNDWKSDKCEYGCDAAAKACKSADPVPTSCTDKETKCEGNKLLTCKSKQWIETDCPYGCQAGACKQADTPSTGDDSYCEGQVLHYKNSDGSDATSDCSQNAKDGIECQKLKDGSSDCVYNHEAVAEVCKIEGDFVPAQCVAATELGIEADLQVLAGIECNYNSENVLVGRPMFAISACGTYNNAKAAFICDEAEAGTYKPAYKPCTSSCTNDSVYAVCDGNKIEPPTDEDIIFDCSSEKDGDKTLGELCAANDSTKTHAVCIPCNSKSYWCATDEESNSYVGKHMGTDKCSSDSSSDQPYYCGDDKLKIDGKEMTGTEACADAKTVAVCMPDEEGITLYCFDKCTTKGATRNVCELSSETNKSSEYVLTCGELDGQLFEVVTSSNDCASTCNAAGDACK